jgi:hypothetical protein
VPSKEDEKKAQGACFPCGDILTTVLAEGQVNKRIAPSAGGIGDYYTLPDGTTTQFKHQKSLDPDGISPQEQRGYVLEREKASRLRQHLEVKAYHPCQP